MKALLQQALDFALKIANRNMMNDMETAVPLINALRTALAQAEKAQPCAWFGMKDSPGTGPTESLAWRKVNDSFEPLYTHPQVAKPLSRAQKAQMWLAATIELPSQENCYLRGIADAEREHGIKEQQP